MRPTERLLGEGEREKIFVKELDDKGDETGKFVELSDAEDAERCKMMTKTGPGWTIISKIVSMKTYLLLFLCWTLVMSFIQVLLFVIGSTYFTLTWNESTAAHFDVFTTVIPSGLLLIFVFILDKRFTDHVPSTGQIDWYMGLMWIIAGFLIVSGIATGGLWIYCSVFYFIQSGATWVAGMYLGTAIVCLAKVGGAGLLILTTVLVTIYGSVGKAGRMARAKNLILSKSFGQRQPMKKKANRLENVESSADY